MNARLENLHHLLYPRQTVMIASSFGGKDNLMVVDWHTPVSFDPFMVAISIGKTRCSLEMVSKSREFVLCVVPHSLEKKVLSCGTTCGRDVDKFEEFELKKDKAWKVKAPLLHDAIANFECKVASEVPAGDHVVFIGEVVEAHVDKVAVKDEKKLFNKGGREFAGL